MKIKCDFCKTEYHIDNMPNTPVQCAVCGHTWNVVTGSKRNAWLMFFASLCALLSAIVFTVAVITQHQIKQKNQGPLIADITGVTTATEYNILWSVGPLQMYQIRFMVCLIWLSYRLMKTEMYWHSKNLCHRQHCWMWAHLSTLIIRCHNSQMV